MDVVIVGGNAAGAKAAARIRRLDPKARITVLEQGDVASYAGCGLPYYVSGKTPDLDALLKTSYGMVRDPEYFARVQNVEVRTNWRAEEIDLGAKAVRARPLPANRGNLSAPTPSSGVQTLPYDKLVLAMGARPVTPKIEGTGLENVLHLASLQDAEAMAKRVEERPGGNAVVIGAGFIGLEVAEALAARKWNVTLLERGDWVLPWALDFEIAALVREHLYEQMVECELGVEVTRIEGDAEGRVTRVATEEENYDADLVVLAVGMQPNVELARAAGLEIGETGALAVDACLRTSDPNIFAGGDLVQNTHLVSGRPSYIPLGSTANKHGRVIGDNVCGFETRFAGILGTFICKVFDYNVGSTGLNETAAREAGLNAYAVCVPGFDKAHYYPGSELVGLKLVAERGTDRLLGVQAAGKGDVARRIDVAAAALRFGATVDDVAALDLCYAPPYAQAMDCLIAAAGAACNASRGLLRPASPAETHAWLEERDDVLMLDVRSASEFARGRVEGDKVAHIPLEDLRDRVEELPRDKTILCMCVTGLRAYAAQRALQAAGFADVRTVGGGTFLWPWKDEIE